MQIKIRTLEIVKGERNVPLTAKIVHQLDYAQGNVNVSRTGCEAVARVSMPDGEVILIKGIHGELVKVSRTNYSSMGWDRVFGKTDEIPKVIL